MNEFNTVALAYTNENGEVVAWSADTFGSPRNYPKTYQDSEQVRDMLSKKLSDREEFANGAINVVSKANSGAGALMGASLRSDKNKFAELGVTGWALAELELHTDYKRDLDLPKWSQVVECVDNKKYKLVNNSCTCDTMWERRNSNSNQFV
jgi:hypothetical protein